MKHEKINLFIYQRMVMKKDKSGKFPKNKASYEDVSWDTNFTKECNEKLTKDMLKGNLKFPINLTLDDTQYFTKPETFVRNDGTKGTKQVLIIKDYDSITQAEFKPQKSLHEMADAIKAGRQAMAEADENGEIE